MNLMTSTLNDLLDKLSKENKTVFHLDDFNIDLLNYDQHSHTNEFLDYVSSHMLPPHIVQPTRIRNNCKTVIDNIYSNLITPNNIFGNFTGTISKHTPSPPNLLLLLTFSLIHHLQN